MVEENKEDLDELQKIIDRSIENAGKFIKSSFKMPEHSLNAKQLVEFVGKGKTVALATVTKAGAPRVAPIGTVFYKGKFYIPTVNSAMRTRHVRNNPEISLTFYQNNDIAIIVHGKAEIVQSDTERFERLETISGSNVQSWGAGNEGVYLRVKAEKIFTYVVTPGDF